VVALSSIIHAVTMADGAEPRTPFNRVSRLIAETKKEKWET
jgi:hypothetical protein